MLRGWGSDGTGHRTATAAKMTMGAMHVGDHSVPPRGA